jgi:predicted transposase YbfD/YdcC
MPSPKPNAIFVAFQTLPDPRKPRNQSYSLFDIVTISILAVLCGADDWVSISLWGQCNLGWLQEHGICLNGIPSHDTLGRFFRFVCPNAFEKCFIRWTQSIAGVIKGVISIDGKTLRGSVDEAGNQKAIHLVSAFASENKIVLGQLATDAKSNEIKAIPLLLALLDIEGSVITIDAAGCQKNIAKDIRERGGDYVLALKGNQSGLHDEVANFFEQVVLVSPEDAQCDYYVSEEKSRGRLEKREIWCSSDIEWLPQRKELTDLRTLVCVRSSRTIKEKSSSELRFYISSLEPCAHQLGTSIRLHWGIENNLHWQLDVSYREDACKVRKDNGAENLSVLRRCTLNLLKADTKTKAGIKNKRAKAGWSHDYLLELLNGK